MVHLYQAQGEFVLPDQVPEHVLFISGGSGITPVMSMLRSLQRRTHRGRVTFLHYAQSPEHQIFAAELDEVRRSGHGIDVHLLHPELGDPNLSPAYLERLVPGYRDLPTWACGPAPMIEAVRAAYDGVGGAARRVLPAAAHLRHLGRGRRRVRQGRPGGAQLRRHAAGAGRGARARARLRMPDGHLLLLHRRQARRHGAQRPDRRGVLPPDEEIRVCVSAPVGDCVVDL